MDEARTNLDVDWMARVLAADLNTPARPGCPFYLFHPASRSMAFTRVDRTRTIM